MNPSPHIGILGGGLSGLLLGALCPGSVVIERDRTFGGLCRTVRAGGFAFDFGGHILFSRDAGALSRLVGLSGVDCAVQPRHNRVCCAGAFAEYPLENGLADLPRALATECARDYPECPDDSAERLDDWLLGTFGRALCRMYFFPYNRKIWKRPLRRLSSRWAHLRVPRAAKATVLACAAGRRIPGHVHQSRFLYPAAGGIQQLTDGLARKVDGRTSLEVEAVRGGAGNWTVSAGGERLRFDELVSTIPLPELIRRLDRVDEDVHRAARRLEYNAVSVVMLGFAHPCSRSFTAVYCPQPSVPFHRVCFVNRFSSGSAPPGRCGLTVEISHRGRTEPPGERTLIRLVCDELSRLGFCRPDRLVFAAVRRRQYAYVVGTLQQRERLAVVRNYVRRRGIHLLGRNGSFEYLNMDQCFLRAERLARRLLRVGRPA